MPNMVKIGVKVWAGQRTPNVSPVLVLPFVFMIIYHNQCCFQNHNILGIMFSDSGLTL